MVEMSKQKGDKGLVWNQIEIFLKENFIYVFFIKDLLIKKHCYLIFYVWILQHKNSLDAIYKKKRTSN